MATQVMPTQSPAQRGDINFLRGGTLLPDEGNGLDDLIETVERIRFTTFVTVSMEILAAAPDVCERYGFSDQVMGAIEAPPEYRLELVTDPAFGAWLALASLATNQILTGVAENTHSLEESVQDFAGLLRQFDERRTSQQPNTMAGTRIRVQRFDIDPLIARVTPPSYTFPTDESEQRRLMESGYSTAFFADVASTALSRIERTWPECHRYIARLVQILGYLPDADFRSCSASRYRGVVYIAARDNSILDLEESIVHEAGHQLLYTIVEAGAIIRADAEPGEYALPWSGQIRDFYGYFHAFYIYVLLAKYMKRVVGQSSAERTEDERRRADNRMRYIINGLVKAVNDFRDNNHFTPLGHELFGHLDRAVSDLAESAGHSRGPHVTSNRSLPV